MEKFPETKNLDESPKNERLSEKKTYNIANMMKSVLEMREIKKSEIKSEDYDRALEAVENIIDLAKKEPNIEKFKNSVLDIISSISYLPGRFIGSIFETLYDMSGFDLYGSNKITFFLKDCSDWFKDLGISYYRKDAQSDLKELKDFGLYIDDDIMKKWRGKKKFRGDRPQELKNN